MKDMDKTDLIVAVLHLNDASMLLKYHEPTISDALLKLSKAIIEKNIILSDDIQYSENIIKDISDESKSV